MVNPDPLARPSASRLANMQTLRGTNSSNAKSRSQLYQELKDTKAKVKMLEMQLKLSKTTICSEETKSTSTPKLSRLAVGRGTLRSRSSNMVTTTW
jgi:outer membrane protease